MARRTSCSTMRPSGPLPVRRPRSMPCSWASRRAMGDARRGRPTASLSPWERAGGRAVAAGGGPPPPGRARHAVEEGLRRRLARRQQAADDVAGLELGALRDELLEQAVAVRLHLPLDLLRLHLEDGLAAGDLGAVRHPPAAERARPPP